MAEIEMKWYVLRAVSGKEAKVKEYIDAEIKSDAESDGKRSHFNGNVSQVLIPTEKVLQVKNGKRVIKERNYLPGYVLVEARLVGETAHKLRQTPNCLGFLPNLDNPTPLRQSEVNRILGQMEETEEEPLDQIIPFAAGEKVKVIDGPFSGFVGDIEEVNDEKKTLTVIVTVFGRNTPLVLGFTQVEKAGE